MPLKRGARWRLPVDGRMALADALPGAEFAAERQLVRITRRYCINLLAQLTAKGPGPPTATRRSACD